jgi:hypothetical protein
MMGLQRLRGEKVMSVKKPGVESLSDAMKQAQAVRERFRAAADRMTAGLLEAEETLRAFKFGVRAEVELIKLVDLEDPAETVYVHLVYGKRNGTFELRVLKQVAYDDDPIADDHVSHASLEYRKMAAEKLPELIKAIVQRAVEQTEELEAAAGTVSHVIQALREGSSS